MGDINVEYLFVAMGFFGLGFIVLILGKIGKILANIADTLDDIEDQLIRITKEVSSDGKKE